MQSGLFRHERDSSVFKDEAGDSGGAGLPCTVECGAAVAQPQEFLEQAHVRAYVDDFVVAVSLDLFLDINAVGAAWHSVDLYHGVYGFQCVKIRFPAGIPNLWTKIIILHNNLNKTA